MDKKTYFYEQIVKPCFNSYFVDYFKDRFNVSIRVENPFNDYLLMCFDDDGVCCGSVSFSYDTDDDEKYLKRHFLAEPILNAVRKDFDNVKHFYLGDLNVETPSDLKPILLDVLGLEKDYYHSYYKEEYLEKLTGEVIF